MSTVSDEKLKEKRERIMASAKGSFGEPNVSEENYNIDLPKALNYYTAFEDDKTKRKWVKKYTAKHSMVSELSIAESEAPDYLFSQIGSVMRLKDRGQFISTKHWNVILGKFNDISIYIENKKIIQSDLENKSPKLPPVDKNKILIEQCMNAVDGEIDHFIINKAGSNFGLKSYFTANNINPTVIKVIGGILKKSAEELATVNFDSLDPEDQMVEGYSNFSRKELKKYKELIDNMISDCNSTKKSRVTKSTKLIKQKPVAKVVNKIKYCPSVIIAGNEIKSLKPESIVGAKELWMYNTKYKIIWSVKSQEGLNVAGSKITGCDVSNSSGKKIKVPEKFFGGSLAKNAINEAYANIEHKAFPANLATNDNLVILRVFS